LAAGLWLLCRKVAVTSRCAGARPAALALGARPLKASGFGALLAASPELSPARLRRSAELGAELRSLWLRAGVLVVRGLEDMTPEDLVVISGHFGPVATDVGAGREHATVQGQPVLRIGNVRDASGRLISVPASSRSNFLPASGSCQYRPEERLPVWHTDGTFQATPPAGSAFFCRQAPPEGGATCFADAAAAWEALPPEEQHRLEGLECVCSLAHHDAKIHALVPEYPVLTPEERAANPPRRVPVVLEHPVTGRRALYGMNSSTCCVVPRGMPVAPAQMDRYDLEAVEDASVSVLRDLLPRMTAPEFTVVWQWRVGDLVVWDNRRTLHCATGYDQDRYTREMWRTSILP